MFTVNGSLCHVCLLCLSCLSHFNPHIETCRKPVHCPHKSSYTDTHTNPNIQSDGQSVSCSTWHRFLKSKTKQPQKEKNQKVIFMSVGSDPFLNYLHTQTNLIQSGSRIRWCHSGASGDIRPLVWQVKMNGSVTLPTSPTPGCQIEDLIVEIYRTALVL